jgi:hypothetical protein
MRCRCRDRLTPRGYARGRDSTSPTALMSVKANAKPDSFLVFVLSMCLDAPSIRSIRFTLVFFYFLPLSLSLSFSLSLSLFLFFSAPAAICHRRVSARPFEIRAGDGLAGTKTFLRRLKSHSTRPLSFLPAHTFVVERETLRPPFPARYCKSFAINRRKSMNGFNSKPRVSVSARVIASRGRSRNS